MVIPILENRLEIIEQLILDSEEICLAVSYIRNSGVSLIRPIYLQSNANFKILVDTKQRMSEKKALIQLLGDGFTIKNFIGPGSFHPKVWLFRKNEDWKAIIGSMNLSLGALRSNIEACILIDRSDAIKFKDWFDALWNDLNKTNAMDRNSVEQLPDAISFIHTPTAQETINNIENPIITSSDREIQDILDFIRAWTHDTETKFPGPSMRKTGWIFKPPHGELNQDKLEELQRVLIAMFSGKSSTFDLNENSARKIIKDANIIYKRKHHKTDYRDRLIRQQINYSEKLGLIAKDFGSRSWNRINLTPRGSAYMNSYSNQLQNFAESAIINHLWFGINIYDFTKTVLQLLPDNRVHYKEFFLFLRHGGVSDYPSYSPEDIVKLIITYRELTQSEKDNIWEQMEIWVNANDKSPSRTSLMNMKGNWAPGIFKDLLICKEFIEINDYLCLA